MIRFLRKPASVLPPPLRRLYAPNKALANEFQVTRFLMVRLLGLCYAMAFLVFLKQGPGLIGENGILPAGRFLDAIERNGVDFWQLPTIFWFFEPTDGFMQGVAWTGLAISVLVLCGYANGILLFVLWALQMSILHIGQNFWSYGWESQLLETGFLAIFLVPLLDGRPFPKTPASRIVLFLNGWLIFRIMLGAGLIKLRGDDVWAWSELSALFYHFETQPSPNGFSWFFHHAPDWLLKTGVRINHVVELFGPFFLLFPRIVRNWAGFVMVLFQISLIASGNLSFLNWLTIVPCLAVIDDRFYRKFLSRSCWTRIRERPGRGRLTSREWTALGFRGSLALLVAGLSVPVVTNLLSNKQIMNTSFDRLHLVGTYGAFGSVGKTRYEFVIEGSYDGRSWFEYGHHGKPDRPNRRPPFFAPYHHRLDWELWINASFSPQPQPWHVFLTFRLLEGRDEVEKLFRHNPFPDRPPDMIRILIYEYRFTTPEERAKTGDWWVREEKGQLLEPLTLERIRRSGLLEQFRWPRLPGHQ